MHAVVASGYETVVVLNRTVERAEELARHFGPPVQAGGLAELPDRLAAADLVVNASSTGMAGHENLAVDWSPVRASAIATDLVYVPLSTPFLEGARKQGLRTVDGLGMLLHQAVRGFSLWFGVRPEVTTELRDLVIRDLVKH